MPLFRRCMPCGMDYDVIVKFETLEEDSDYIINQCGLQDRIRCIVRILDCNSDISAHARSNLCYLICLGHAISSREVTNTILYIRKDFFRSWVRNMFRVTI